MVKPLGFEDEVVFRGCRRNSKTAHHALRKIEDARARLVRGIFWFIDGALVDDKLLKLIDELPSFEVREFDVGYMWDVPIFVVGVAVVLLLIFPDRFTTL